MTDRSSVRSTRIIMVGLVLAASGALAGGSVATAPIAHAAPAAPTPITGINKPTTWTGSLLQPVAIVHAHGGVWFADRAQDPNPQGESLGTIDRITDAGYVEGWPVGLDPTSLTVGPDHNLWYGMDDGYIGRMSPTTHVRRLFNTQLETDIAAIAPGPGGLWFVGGNAEAYQPAPFVGRITTKGKITIYRPKSLTRPVGISAAGGSIWILDEGGINSTDQDIGASVIRLTPGKGTKKFTTPLLGAANLVSMAITTGPDHALWIADGPILRLTTAGHWSGFGKTNGRAGNSIITGPDKALWYGDGAHIGRITITGHITRYVGFGASLCFGSSHTLWTALGNGGGVERIRLHSKTRTVFQGGINQPSALVSADKSLWFTNYGDEAIGRFVPGKGAIFYSSARIDQPTDLVVGPDKALWFTNSGSNTIGRFSLTTHKVTTYHGRDIDQPTAITVGPDKALWFANAGNHTIGRVTVHGKVSHYSGTANAVDVVGIATGPDGALWFVTQDQDAVLRMDPTTHHVTKLAHSFGPLTAIISAGGYLWISGEDSLYRVSPSGGVVRHDAPISGSNLSGLGRDSAGRIWFTAQPEEGAQSTLPGGIGVRATSTKVIFRTANNSDVGADAITQGPDGHMWFISVYDGPGAISRVTTKS